MRLEVRPGPGSSSDSIGTDDMCDFGVVQKVGELKCKRDARPKALHCPKLPLSQSGLPLRGICGMIIQGRKCVLALGVETDNALK